tara:strand:+ start:131 stop:241 length:111 start_codon:yes stop_codon:yes gene_type:complete
MKRLTATICLTIAVLLESVEMSRSDENDTLWRYKDE